MDVRKIILNFILKKEDTFKQRGQEFETSKDVFFCWILMTMPLESHNTTYLRPIISAVQGEDKSSQDAILTDPLKL